jgi:alcohol dehydrogenase (cytochrome c)
MKARRLAFWLALPIAVGMLAIGAALVLSEGIRWRASVVGLMLAGDINDVSWSELLAMLRPGSLFYVRGFIDTPNPYAVIVNPHTSNADRETGSSLFVTYCSACHGSQAEGQTAPKLIGRTLKRGDSDWALFRSIANGVPELGMPPSGLADTEIWQVVGYLRAMRSGAEASAAVSRAAPRLDVPAARIERAAAEPHNWFTYSGSYTSWRHSSLTEITRDNVATLTLAWALQLGSGTDFVEASPIVVDGVAYFTAPPSDVLAIDALTGKLLWRHSRELPQLGVCCSVINRGVAVLDHRVFVGTPDGYLVALDAQTGKVLWESQVGDHELGYSITVAPLAVRDKIVVGISGGEFGVRGFLDAYDAATGVRAWRFYTIPAPGEPGSETWSGDAWQSGGGPTWVTGSFDPALGLVYWGVGNPSPDYNGDVRPGDNLYSDSVIALDADTGELKWHFQFTPHDEHDWDANQIPVLVDRAIDGTDRRLMLWANRNGFYYVLDRATGEFLHATPFATQNWATGIDSNGRPIVAPDAAPSERGTLTWPGLSGGANWWSPSYSPVTDLIYVPFAEAPKIFIKNVDLEEGAHRPGQYFLGGATVSTGDPMQLGIRALRPMTGEVAWEYWRKEPRNDIGRIGGVLSIAGNVVFVGDVNDFVALDATDGTELWRTNLGGEINASPVGFAVNGQQHVAIPAGNTLYAFRLPSTGPMRGPPSTNATTTTP